MQVILCYSVVKDFCIQQREVQEVYFSTLMLFPLHLVGHQWTMHFGKATKKHRKRRKEQGEREKEEWKRRKMIQKQK